MGVTMIKRLSFRLVVILVLLLSACSTSEDNSSPPPEDIDRNEGMGDTGENGIQTDEEQLVEARHEARLDLENKKDLTQFEAEQLVKEHLNISNQSDTVVMFDHEENDKYFIRVYDLIDDKKNSKKGLYIVDPSTGVISNGENK